MSEPPHEAPQPVEVPTTPPVETQRRASSFVVSSSTPSQPLNEREMKLLFDFHDKEKKSYLVG